MANTNAPFGFRWLGYNRGGAVANFSTRVGKIVYSYSTANLYKGDVLTDQGDGYLGRYTSGDTGSNVAGIALGFEYYSDTLGRKVWTTYLPTSASSHDITVHLCPINGVPPQEFMVQAYDSYFQKTDIGQLIEPYYGTAGTAVGGHGKSGMTIKRSTNQNTTSTLPFRIVDFYSSISAPGSNGVDDTSNYNIMIVSSNPFEATGK
jgi:hypothetical protein